MAEADVLEVEPWAARVAEIQYDRNTSTESTRTRLVVVLAASKADARRESGLIEADFRPATAAELDAWHEEVSEDLTAAEVRKLAGLVRSELIDVANRRARERAFEGAGADERHLWKAIRMSVLRGKLLAWLDELDEEQAERVDAA